MGVQEGGEAAGDGGLGVVQVGERCGGVGGGAVEGLLFEEADAGEVLWVGGDEGECLEEREGARDGPGARGGHGRGGGGQRDYEQVGGVDPDLGGG